jgi:hypothetical protein
MSLVGSPIDHVGQGDVLLTGVQLPIGKAAGGDPPRERQLERMDARQLNVLDGGRIHLVQLSDPLAGQHPRVDRVPVVGLVA